MNNKLKVVLLTIDKAGQILIERLIGVLPTNISIELVITRETRPYDVKGNPVVNICNKANIKCIQPDFNHTTYLDEVRNIGPDLIIISNFHKIIKRELIELSTIGTFNIHSSLLPELRGGTSVIWALKNGLTQTGVTIHYVTEGIDDGDIVRQKKVNVDFWDSQGSLYEKISTAKFEIFVSFLMEIVKRNIISRTPQDHKKATYLPKRKDSDGLIQKTSSMIDIYNHIRSFDPWTGAYFLVNDKKIRLRKVIPIKKKLESKIADNFLVLSKKCDSGIQSLIIESVTDIIENHNGFNKSLAIEVFEYWKNNTRNDKL